MKRAVCIVGGGAAAVSLLDALQRHGDHYDVTIVEPADTLGPGRAYQADSDSALLNQQAGRMSLRNSEPDHFIKWVRGHDEQFSTAENSEFLPRRLFGQYLNFHAHRTLESLRESGSDVRIIRDVVTSAHEDFGGVWLGTAGGTTFRSDRVVLCTGTGGPVDAYELAKQPGYVHDPYPLRDQLPDVAADRDVLVLGTGLTAVDIALYLLDRGHRGAISMLSRRGVLPAVRSFAAARPLRYLTGDALAAGMSCGRLLRELRNELRAAGFDVAEAARDLGVGEPAHQRLARQVAAGDVPWQPTLIQAAMQSIERLWPLLPARERDRFMRRWHHVFNSLVNPMPPRTAHRLLSAMDAGQLTVHSGVNSVVRDSDGFLATTMSGQVRGDLVVNAIREETGITNIASTALLDGLIGDGAARVHPYGGIDVDPGTNAILDRAGVPSSRLFALGQLTCGVHYYTSSMTMITRRAAMLAGELSPAMAVR
ncbi:hypothetical protein D5S17_26480 [Pseudonocardiaceae bacterium YIM PH 21723]|nr:hypothetical protein D5S17_26480 [Pseudonocardiaceae bacterium YIM PH 21723]